MNKNDDFFSLPVSEQVYILKAWLRNYWNREGNRDMGSRKLEWAILAGGMELLPPISQFPYQLGDLTDPRFLKPFSIELVLEGLDVFLRKKEARVPFNPFNTNEEDVSLDNVKLYMRMLYEDY
ncbi:MAG: hypothetical protein ACRC62_04690 [Microcoleus sp.]